MDIDDLATRILAGERRALARAITLVESGRADHRSEAIALFEKLKGHGREALRIGLSGTPGVGKSTFIDSFGMMLVEHGLRVAVLAVDPSSSRSGGSILGDKTRMDRLARFYGERLGLEPQRVIDFTFAHAGLSASWDMMDGFDPAFALGCAEVLAPLATP